MRLRLDDWELSPEVQKEVSRRWPLLTTETLGELADLGEYKTQFLRLFGFGIDGVDYARGCRSPRRSGLNRPGGIGVRTVPISTLHGVVFDILGRSRPIRALSANQP